VLFPNYELLDQRRAVREQRELVKLTRKLRRDLATHRREMRMLLLDLTRMFGVPEEATFDTAVEEANREPEAVATR